MAYYTEDQQLYNILYDNPEAITYLKRRYQTERIWKFCIEKEPKLFRKMKDPSPEMCEYALDIDGENIVYMTTKFQHIPITKRMAYIALRNYPAAILYIPTDTINEEMLDIAFDAQPALISHFTNLTPTYLRKKVKENSMIIRYIANPDEDLACEALADNPNLCVHFTSMTPRMIAVLREKKPEMAEMYLRSLEESETMKNAKDCQERGAEETSESNPY